MKFKQLVFIVMTYPLLKQMDIYIVQKQYNKYYEMVDNDKYVPTIDDYIICLKHSRDENYDEIITLCEFILVFLSDFPTKEQIVENIEYLNFYSSRNFYVFVKKLHKGLRLHEDLVVTCFNKYALSHAISANKLVFTRHSGVSGICLPFKKMYRPEIIFYTQLNCCQYFININFFAKKHLTYCEFCEFVSSVYTKDQITEIERTLGLRH